MCIANAGQIAVLVLAVLANSSSTASYECPYVYQAGDVSPAFSETHGIKPRWVGRQLLALEDNDCQQPVIRTTDANGKTERIQLDVPEAGYVTVYDLSAASDRGLALVGSAVSGSSRGASFLAWIAPDRKTQTIVRLTPYVAQRVAVAADNSIWTVGWVFDDTARIILHENVVKRFDTFGKLLGTFAVRAHSMFGANGNATFYSTLRASKDRVAWLTNGLDYIEFSLSGQETYHIVASPLASVHHIASLTMAVSNDNDVIMAASTSTKVDLWSLDRSKRLWQPVQFPAEGVHSIGSLLGFDGDRLVLAPDTMSVRHYSRLKLSSSCTDN